MPVPGALSAFSVTRTPGDEELLLSFEYALSGPVATQLNVDLYTVTGGTPSGVSSWKIVNTIEPHTYRIPAPPATWRVIATPENTSGFASTQNTSSDLTVAATPYTVNVSVNPSPTTVRLAGQGFLLGLTDGVSVQNQLLLEPLKPKQWRFSYEPSAEAYSRTKGISTTNVLSDFWYNEKRSGGYTITPWSDWAAFEAFYAAKVQAAVNEGWIPSYWDIWNEQNASFGLGWNPADSASFTIANWLELFRRAYAVIKGINPAMKIVAPSISFAYWTQHAGPPANWLDLGRVLDDAVAHGMVYDAISWHENDLQVDGDVWKLPGNVDRHISNIKLLLAGYPGTISGNRIHVNEYMPSEVYAQPGWTIGYLRALEDGGVTEANRAVWAPGDTAQIDGLLTSGQPTGTYWTHRKYADLQGQTRMTVTSSSSFQFSGIATRDDAAKKIRVLLGRHWTTTGTAAAPVTVTIAWPYGTAPVHVVTTNLGIGTGIVTTAPTGSMAAITPVAGTLTISIPSFNDRDGIFIEAGQPPAETAVAVETSSVAKTSPIGRFFLRRVAVPGSTLRGGYQIQGLSLSLNGVDVGTGADLTRSRRFWSEGLWSEGTWSGFGITNGLFATLSASDTNTSMVEGHTLDTAGPTSFNKFDTGQGVEGLSTVTTALSPFDVGTGQSLNPATLLATVISLGDTGTGSNVAALTAFIPVPSGSGQTDTGSGTDATTGPATPVAAFDVSQPSADVVLSLSVSMTRTDVGTGNDPTPVLATAITSAGDTGSGTESSVWDRGLIDSASGTDAVSARSITAVDAWQFIASATLATNVNDLVLNRNDAGSGTEGTSSLITNLTLTVTDTGHGVEGLSDRSTTHSDTGHGTDTATLTVTHARSDTTSGNDLLSLIASFVSSDSGTTSTTKSVTVDKTAAEIGFGNDSAHLTFIVIELASSDIGFGDDQPPLVLVGVSAIDTIIDVERVRKIKYKQPGPVRRLAERHVVASRSHVRRATEDEN